MKRYVLFALSVALWSGPSFGGNIIVSKVSNDTGVFNGEGWVVTDPRDPQQVVTVWLATSADYTTNPLNLTKGYCGVARSTDGGVTWPSTKPVPFVSGTIVAGQTVGVQSDRRTVICGDPVAGVGPDGTVFAAAANVGSPQWTQGTTSPDNGWSWTDPKELFGINQYVAQTVAAQAPTDAGMGRAWMAVDAVTGDAYVHTQVDVATFGRMITASTDGGKTWSTPHPVGSTSAGPFAAANGVVAVGITLSGTVYFQTSTDYGVTWDRKDLTAAVGAGAGSPMVAADPSTAGRFAVRLTRSGSHEVWVTTDSGDNWTQTKVITPDTGDSFNRPAIAYSASGTGALGVVWRAQHTDGSYDIDAVVSTDGGNTWPAIPVRLTAARGPAPSHSLSSDDCACNVHLDENSLSVVWGDWTSAQQDLWYGRYYYQRPRRPPAP